jgi:hypothetical protein
LGGDNGGLFGRLDVVVDDCNGTGYGVLLLIVVLDD